MSRYWNDLFVEPETEDDISHHGILGQKWGVRRFQNPDGSLTAKGRQRYGEDLIKEVSKKKHKGYGIYRIANDSKNKLLAETGKRLAPYAKNEMVFARKNIND